MPTHLGGRRHSAACPRALGRAQSSSERREASPAATAAIVGDSSRGEGEARRDAPPVVAGAPSAATAIARADDERGDAPCAERPRFRAPRPHRPRRWRAGLERRARLTSPRSARAATGGGGVARRRAPRDERLGALEEAAAIRRLAAGQTFLAPRHKPTVSARARAVVLVATGVVDRPRQLALSHGTRAARGARRPPRWQSCARRDAAQRQCATSATCARVVAGSDGIGAGKARHRGEARDRWAAAPPRCDDTHRRRGPSIASRPDLPASRASGGLPEPAFALSPSAAERQPRRTAGGARLVGEAAATGRDRADAPRRRAEHAVRLLAGGVQDGGPRRRHGDAGPNREDLTAAELSSARRTAHAACTRTASRITASVEVATAGARRGTLARTRRTRITWTRLIMTRPHSEK